MRHSGCDFERWSEMLITTQIQKTMKTMKLTALVISLGMTAIATAAEDSKTSTGGDSKSGSATGGTATGGSATGGTTGKK